MNESVQRAGEETSPAGRFVVEVKSEGVEICLSYESGVFVRRFFSSEELTNSTQFWRDQCTIVLQILDPESLTAIADEIGGEFKHSARADSLRVIASRERAAIKALQKLGVR